MGGDYDCGAVWAVVVSWGLRGGKLVGVSFGETDLRRRVSPKLAPARMIAFLARTLILAA
jgi:hypothetical protein